MAFIEQVKEFDEKVIALDRVARVVKGGRRFRFRATVVVGNGRGRVGVGIGKGGEVMTAIAKAVSKAKRQMITVELNGNTIPHEVEVRFSGAQVLLKPASAGTGVIAGGAVRNVVEAAGIHDLLSKSIGSSNKVNNAYATIMALSQLQQVKKKTQDQTSKNQESEIKSQETVAGDLAPVEKKAATKKAATAKTAAKKPAPKVAKSAAKSTKREATK